jgi:hypothetical protein
MKPSITLEQAQQVVSTKTAPKVTIEHIASLVKDVAYISHDTTTVAILTVENGFKFIGTSTPASAENFDREVGKRYAYDNAIKQIWTHEGYLLRELLHQSEKDSCI